MDGRQVDSPELLLEAIRNAERQSHRDGYDVPSAEVLRAANSSVPRHMQYQLVSPMPSLPPTVYVMPVMVCIFRPDMLPADLQSAIARSRLDNSTDTIDPDAFIRWPNSLLGRRFATPGALVDWANERSEAACSIVKDHHRTGGVETLIPPPP